MTTTRTMTGAAPKGFFSGALPRIGGHRGAAGAVPENTLPSFRRALEEGATFLEMDVHATRDGHVVIIHDATVERTTDGAGAVRQMSLAELRRLDAGYRFTTDGGSTHPFRGQGIRIPTLREFFVEFPSARATVEIKELPGTAMEALFDLIEECSRARGVLLATEDDAVMRSARAIIRERGLPVATGFSTGETRALMNALWAREAAPRGGARPGTAPRVVAPREAAPSDSAPSEAAPPEAVLPRAAPRAAAPREAGPPDATPPDATPPDATPPEVPGQALQIPRRHQGLELVTPATLAAARAMGVEVHVWTVNEADEMRELLALGVDGIITDFPGRLRGVIDQAGAR